MPALAWWQGGSSGRVPSGALDWGRRTPGGCFCAMPGEGRKDEQTQMPSLLHEMKARGGLSSLCRLLETVVSWPTRGAEACSQAPPAPG